MSNRIDLTQFEGLATREGSSPYREAYYSAEKMLPDLIAELKRCYEKIDSLQGKIDKANYARQRYCDEWPDLPYPDHPIDNVCDAYEEVTLALD